MLGAALLSGAVRMIGSDVGARSEVRWTGSRPLQVCVASIQDFAARCDSGPAGLRAAMHPLGPVPRGGWCRGEGFCGYSVDVFRAMATEVGLREEYDYRFVCMGERGFDEMLDEMYDAHEDSICDIAASSVTVTAERIRRGLTFSASTLQSSLATMVYAPSDQKNVWQFMKPLHWNVWISLIGTIITTSILTTLIEAVLTTSSSSSSVWCGMRDSMWHALSHTLLIDAFSVKSLPARIIAAAFGFVVLIVSSTYTANMVVFLTTRGSDLPVQNVRDLQGRAVVTVSTYQERLNRNWNVAAIASEGRDYQSMIQGLRSGKYRALISDNTQLEVLAAQDPTCSLRTLDDLIEPFETAFAFRAGFPYLHISGAIDAAMLILREDGTLNALQEKHMVAGMTGACATEQEETTVIGLQSLKGLWVVILAGAVAAEAAGLVMYLWACTFDSMQAKQVSGRLRRIFIRVPLSALGLLAVNLLKQDTRNAPSVSTDRNAVRDRWGWAVHAVTTKNDDQGEARHPAGSSGSRDLSASPARGLDRAEYLMRIANMIARVDALSSELGEIVKDAAIGV